MGLQFNQVCDAPLGATMPKRIQDLPEEYLSHQRTIARAIGARMRLRRSELDLTQEHLRARMEFEHVFISRTQYSRIENGDVLPNAAELIALRAILDVTFDWLLLGEKGDA
jgi:DNA-binding XRE family transcriptional regulator